MLERHGDPFAQDADAVGITTNGAVDRLGRAVMGRGCALQAAQRRPALPVVLGAALRARGNHVHLLTARSEAGQIALAGQPMPYHLSPSQ